MLLLDLLQREGQHRHHVAVAHCPQQIRRAVPVDPPLPPHQHPPTSQQQFSNLGYIVSYSDLIGTNVFVPYPDLD